MLISHLNSHLKKEIFWTPTRTFKLPEVFHRRVIQLRDELSRLTGCQAMREWLIYNHPVNPTISTLLQRTNEEKSVGLTISTQWHPWIVDDLACCLVTSCVHPCAPIIQLNQPLQVNPAFLSWPLPVTVQRAGKCLLFQRWPYGQVLPRVGGTVLLQWTRPRTRGCLLLPQHVTLLAEHSHAERQETSLPQDHTGSSETGLCFLL